MKNLLSLTLLEPQTPLQRRLRVSQGETGTTVPERATRSERAGEGS